MRSVFIAVLAFAVFLSFPVLAEDVQEVHLNFKSHAFVPAELAVPAGKKIKLIIKNEDDSSAEFESADLGREKVVTANGQITVYLGPLDAGSYEIFDDFRRDTTKGKIIAK